MEAHFPQFKGEFRDPFFIGSAKRDSVVSAHSREVQLMTWAECRRGVQEMLHIRNSAVCRKG
jgi:hypothetical protein